MSTSIAIVTSHSAQFVTIGDTHIIPKQSLVGDWEGGQWGDGRFPGSVSVGAIATLRHFAQVAEIPTVKAALTSAADNLTLTLSDQIESFQRALGGATRI